MDATAHIPLYPSVSKLLGVKAIKLVGCNFTRDRPAFRHGSNMRSRVLLLLLRYWLEGNIRLISLADVTRITVV